MSKPLLADDPYHRLMQLIDAVHIKTRQFTERRLSSLNMTYPQLGALMALEQKDGVTQTELADSLETDATTVTVLCDSLEKRGWLRRTLDESDRRVKRLMLTESGRTAYALARQRLQPEDDCMARKVSPADLGTVIPFLEGLHREIKCLLVSESETPRKSVGSQPDVAHRT